jgi:hypothetical protein
MAGVSRDPPPILSPAEPRPIPLESIPPHFPIHARSSHAIIPSTTASNVVTMNRERRVNRHEVFRHRTADIDPVSNNKNQNGTKTFIVAEFRRQAWLPGDGLSIIELSADLPH